MVVYMYVVRNFEEKKNKQKNTEFTDRNVCGFWKRVQIYILRIFQISARKVPF